MVLPQLCAALLSSWPEERLGGPKPRELHLLVQGTGVGKVCCYLFPDDASEPRWVAKVPRSPDDNALLLREYSLIQALRQRGGPYLRATLPRPAWLTAVAGHLVAVEPYLHGSAMDDLLVSAADQGQRSERACCEFAIDWLLRSQLELQPCARPLTEMHVRRYLLDPIHQLRATARLAAVEATFLDRVEQRIRHLAAAARPLPLVFKHGDFQPANILLDREAIHVIDWEFGEPRALPLMDVFGLLMRVHARTHRLEEIDGYLEDYLRAFDAVFLDGGSFAALAVEHVARACEALQVDPDWTPMLFVLFLVSEANKYYTFLSRRAARGYVYLLRSRGSQTDGPVAEQLARQKYVWLLGHLIATQERLVFGRSIPGGRTPVEPVAA